MWCCVSVALNLLCGCLAGLRRTTITFKMLILASTPRDEEIQLSSPFLWNWAVFALNVLSQTQIWEFADINERKWQKTHILWSPLTPKVTKFSSILTSCSSVTRANLNFCKFCRCERDNSHEQRLLGSWTVNELFLPLTLVFSPPTTLTCYLCACGGVITFCRDNRQLLRLTLIWKYNMIRWNLFLINCLHSRHLCRGSAC